MAAKLVIICGVNEMHKDACADLADAIEDAFIRVATRPVEVKKLVAGEATRDRALSAIRDAVSVLGAPDGRAVVYYNGHGDQMRDTSGDEADGKDEFWRMRGGAVLDDEITRIVSDAPCASTSLLTVISDSCSSGSMIDANRASEKLRWVSIGACTDRQSALASAEGGVMTCFGMLPTLSEHADAGSPCCASDLVFGIRTKLDIDTQKVTWDASGFTHIVRVPLI